MKDLISVIMPTYNRGYIISLAIDSILNQTYRNIELIIIDDCSNDNTEEIISKYHDKRLKYIKLDKKNGANYARNIGLEKAKGKYISFQDSDDYSMPYRIEKEYNTLLKENADLVFSSFYKAKTGYEKYASNGDYSSIKAHIFPKRKIPSNNILNVLLYQNVVTTQVLFGKKSIFEKVYFDNNLSRFQDWDLVIRIAKDYNIFHLDEPLLYMFIQNDSITKSNKKGYQSLEIILNKYNILFNNKQKCRILFRIGTFKMMENIDAKSDFKRGLKLYKNIEFITIYILYRLKIYKYIYKIIKK